MAAKIIPIMIGKGGSGKTTTAGNLGAALAERGNRICLIDFDPQAGLTRSLGIVPKSLEKDQTIYYVLLGEVPLSSILVQPLHSSVHLAPANLDLVGCVKDLPEDGQALKQVLARASSFYDFILVDCPPNLGILTVNAVIAADLVLIPVQCEYLAYEAAGDVTMLIKELRPNLPYYVFPTMAKRTRLSEDIINGLQHEYNGHLLESKINNTVRFGDASMTGMSILHFSKGSRAASQYRHLAHELLTTIVNDKEDGYAKTNKSR